MLAARIQGEPDPHVTRSGGRLLLRNARAKKRRPKNLPLLTVPRQVARDLILAQRTLNRVT